jgi:hypothetical protein
MEYEEYQTVFNEKQMKDKIQCAFIEKRQNRHWVRLVGLGYDLQLWGPDLRKPVHNNKVDYIQCTAKWIKDIIDPWLEKFFNTMKLYITEDDYDSLGMAMVTAIDVGSRAESRETHKEIIVYRYPQVFHVYNIEEYGRRWYRTLIFSSDSILSYHSLKMAVLRVKGKVVDFIGDTQTEFEPKPTLIIQRDVRRNVEGSGGQTFLPRRFLYGLIPTVLLEQYSFWQNQHDDSLTGYMAMEKAKITSRSILRVNVLSQGKKIQMSYLDSFLLFS